MTDEEITIEAATCYLCGHSADMCDPHTQSRLWVSGIPYTTPCGSSVSLSAHTGCLMHKYGVKKKHKYGKKNLQGGVE